MQVGTYPTRNFAQSCYVPDIGTGESFLFRSPLRVAAQLGPYHSPTLDRRSGVWPLRILSTAIHLTGQLSNPSQPLLSQVIASLHEADHLGEAIEAPSLHRPQWIRFEERHHSFGQLSDSPNAEFLAITVIDGDLSAAEETSELLEEGDIPLMLYHAELWKDLPANRHRGLPIDTDEEASLSIDETNHPLGTQAFLLVVCTDRIVTHLLSTVGFARVPSI